MNAPRMRRRYRTSSPKRGHWYLLLFLVMSAFYVGQRVYAQRLLVELGTTEQSLKAMEGKVDSLRAVRDRLTSPGVLGMRAEALGLKPASVQQLARVPLNLPVPEPDLEMQEHGLGGALVRVWRWLDGPEVEKQEVMAAP